MNNISVVVPTRNEVQNIQAFLDSLHAAVELVVVDKSEDGTDALIRQVRPANTQIIRSDVRITQARQLGAEAAQGEWLIFSDADIAFAPNYFDLLAQYPCKEAFFGPKHATAERPRYSRFFTASQWGLYQFGVPAASGSNMGMHHTVFKEVGGFRLDLPVNEDTELMMRLHHAGFRVDYRHDLAVYSLDDRRLDQGMIRKTLHSLIRCVLLLINLRLPLPHTWLTSDWGYWRRGAGGGGFRPG